MIYLYYTNLANIPWNNLEKKIGIVSDHEKDKIYTYRFEKDRITSLGGKLLLLEAIQEALKTKVDRLPPIAYNTFGKPYFSDLSFCFNISHSSTFAICVFSEKEGELGTDIEEINPIDINEYRSVLNDSEYSMLKDRDHSAFFRLWTIKEAIMKAEGKGFHLNPLSIEIETTDAEHTCSLNNKTWFIKTFQINSSMISIASSFKEEIVCKEIKMER